MEITAMWFGHAPEEMEWSDGDSVDIFCTVTEKTFRQRPMLNVTVRSIRFSEDPEDPIYRKHYNDYRTKGEPLPDSCRINRSMMVALYRYLTATAVNNGEVSTVLRRPGTVIRAVKNRCSESFNVCRLLLCLDTMQELGLINYTEGKTLSVTLYPTQQKVDLCKAHDWDKISYSEKG